MPAEVSVTNRSTKEEKFYSSFNAAISDARKGDLITVYADTKEQMFIDKSVDINIASDVIFRRKKDSLPLFVCTENEKGDEILTCSISSFTMEYNDE